MSLLTIAPIKLYKMSAGGKLQVWCISAVGAQLMIQHGYEGGLLQTQHEDVIQKRGKSMTEQIRSRFNSRVNKQLLKGYKETREEAFKGRSNALGFVQPMLAQVYSKTKSDISDAFVQYKYDGNRCLITRQEGKTIAYSRRGKVIDTIGHITDDLNLDEGETVDGELYCHGATLQEIVSWVRRPQPGTLRVKFHAYDFVSDRPYAERLARLQSISGPESFHVVPTLHMSEVKSLDDHFRNARDAGYEGLILRVGDGGYEADKRSRSLLKVKEFMDQEFRIVHFSMSEQRVPIITCMSLGGTFDVTAPGSIEQRYRDYHAYREGTFTPTLLTVKFTGFTKDNIPFQPVATGYRDDV